MRKFNKIFNVHLGKAGTTSLTAALKILGLKGFHYNVSENLTLHNILKNNKSANPIFDNLIENFDFLSDFGMSADIDIIERLEDQYPNSLFILTTREINSWLQSIMSQVESNKRNPNYKGTWIKYNQDQSLDLYYSVHIYYKQYFLNRSNCLILPLESNKWKLLCDFLQCKIPGIEYPKLNTKRIFN